MGDFWDYLGVPTETKPTSSTFAKRTDPNFAASSRFVMIIGPHAETLKGRIDDVHLHLGEQGFTLDQALENLKAQKAPNPSPLCSTGSCSGVYMGPQIQKNSSRIVLNNIATKLN